MAASRNGHLCSRTQSAPWKSYLAFWAEEKKKPKLCSNIIVIKLYRLSGENVQTKEKKIRDRKIIHRLSTQRHLLLVTFQGVSFQIKNVIFRDVKCCQSHRAVATGDAGESRSCPSCSLMHSHWSPSHPPGRGEQSSLAPRSSPWGTASNKPPRICVQDICGLGGDRACSLLGLSQFPDPSSGLSLSSISRFRLNAWAWNASKWSVWHSLASHAGGQAWGQGPDSREMCIETACGRSCHQGKPYLFLPGSQPESWARSPVACASVCPREPALSALSRHSSTAAEKPARQPQPPGSCCWVGGTEVGLGTYLGMRCSLLTRPPSPR